MDFSGISLRKTLNITKLYSVHYFEFSKTYAFPGERHDFWEMVYVDKGEIIATAEDTDFPVSSGEVLFHQPNEWHNIRANGTIAPNVMVLSFQCQSSAMSAFVGKRMRPDSRQKELLSLILSECKGAFSSRLDDPYDNNIVRAKDQPVGSEQLVSLYLTEFLLSLLRNLQQPRTVDRKSGSLPLLDAIIAYMEHNINRKITLELLAAEFHISRSYIKKIFAQYKQTGAMHYLIRLRVTKAKDYLRESDKNVSQIAELLGYENVYYFCNQFKKLEGMSPLEYRKSVKALGDRMKALTEA